jgi:hypothetical protein
LNLIFVRGKTPFQITDAGRTIVNQFTLKLSHQGDRDYQLSFRIKDEDLREKVNLVTPGGATFMNGPRKNIVVFFKFGPAILNSGSRRVTVEVVEQMTQKILVAQEVVLVGATN